MEFVISIISLILAMIAFKMQITSNGQILEIQKQIKEVNHNISKLEQITNNLDTLKVDLEKTKHELKNWIVAMS